MLDCLLWIHLSIVQSPTPRSTAAFVQTGLQSNLKSGETLILLPGKPSQPSQEL
jgi:hypothetical protein